jgi:pimeloyl-ACP methyl ester carboxylesterase
MEGDAMSRCLGIVWILFALAGCAATGPLEVLTYESAGEANPNLFVFMRGIGGSHRSFEEEGLVAGVRGRGLPFDMAAPNAHVGYYADRSLIERLKADVIDPARARGYRQIWLVGFSMGGLGSLLYLKEHPEDIVGVCLIAPYLGSAEIVQEIEIAGGLTAWRPGPYNPQRDWERMLWHWLQTDVAGRPDRKVLLGYGTADVQVFGNASLAAVLPRDRVHVIEGGKHDYPTFKALWNRILDGGW